MKQAVWGYAVLVLGVIAIMITWFFAQVTNTDQHNYNLLKETVENAMYDAVDLSAYRKDGTVRIDETKFVESFVRRFAENADLSNTYQVDIYDVNEVPPKVSLSVNSCKQTNGTTCTNSAENLTFTISNKIDAILEAEWDGEKAGYINIVFDARDGTAEAMQTDGQTKRGSNIELQIKKGDPIPVATFSLTGCTFKGWYEADGTKLGDGLIAVENKTYVAQYNANTYSIIYNSNGGSVVSNGEYIYGAGTAVTSSNPTKDGYDFAGWFTTADGGTQVTNISKTQIDNITLYAHWTIKKYTITYNANGGSGAPSQGTKNHGSTYKISSSTPTRTNYTFNGWNTQADGKGTSYSSGGNYESNSNVTLYAKWKINTITCDAGTYLNKSSCSDCPAGSYCTGGTWTPDSDTHGKYACKAGTYSTAKSSSCNYYKWDENGSYCWNFALNTWGDGNRFDDGELYLCPNVNNSGCVVASNTACSNINNKYSYFRLGG